MQENTAIQLGRGGVSADTEVMAVKGPVEVSNIEPGTLVYALDVSTQVAKVKPITHVESFTYSGQFIQPEARRVDLRLHPDHRIPYQTKKMDIIRFARAGDIEDRVHYHFINEWQTRSAQEVDSFDITDYTDNYVATVDFEGHGKTFRSNLPDGCEPAGYTWNSGFHFDPPTFKEFQRELESAGAAVAISGGNRHWKRPYRFDADDFLRFLGWFIAEGCVTWHTNCDSAAVVITQEKPEFKENISSLLERMDFRISEVNDNYKFSSVVYANLLERWCGNRSKDREFPNFIWDISTRQQRLLLETLLNGDGNAEDAYYTSSRKLRDDVLRLCVELGVKPRYSSNRGVWRLFTGKVNDKLHSRRQVRWVDYDGSLTRLTVKDHPVVLLGRNGKFQWTAASSVS